MSAFIITCPVCKKQYKLTPSDPASLAKQSFTCPNCKYAAPFTALIKDLPVPQPITRTEEAPVKPQQGDSAHSATKVAHAPGKQPKAFLEVAGSNSKFLLNQGTYILGRKSSDSKATLQLAPDISMSRQHARLAVQLVAGKPVAQIMGLKDENPVIINGKVCAAGQRSTLKSGDHIQLGATTIVYSVENQ